MYPGAYADRCPDKPAVVMAGSGTTVTYRQLEENSCRLARLLHAHGLRRGDHLALLTDNHPRHFEVYWAALRSGLHLTPVNWHLSADEAAYIVDDCGATALIASASGVGELAAALVARTPRVGLRLAYGGDIEGHLRYEDALAAMPPEPLPHQPRGADMLYSSGTTGRPKGIEAALPDREVHEPGDTMTAVYGPRYGIGEDSVYLSPAPLYHAAPLRFTGMVQALGGTVVVMERFDAEQALQALERHRVTHSQWVPTMFVRMLKLDPAVREKYDLSALRVAVHAAAPCPVEVKRAMIGWWGPVLEEYYASTEGNGVTMIGSAEWLRKPGSVGRAVLGELHVCDPDDGAELPAGRTGTVYFARDELPFQYHNAPEKTARAQHPAHPTWTTLGDVGHVDEDGYLFLTDRQDFTVISGGVNIYPQEIEDCLTLHPKVLDVAVIGVPDAEMGEAVKAVVEPAPGAVPGTALAAELLAHVREHLAGFKVPRSVDFTDALPRTPAGKLLKRRLKERYGEEGHGEARDGQEWARDHAADRR